MRALSIIVAIGMLAEPATAEVNVDLAANDPVAALPVVSADKLYFLRAFRRWRPTCKRPDIYVEDGGIDASVEEPQYSSTQLIGGCGEAVDAFSGNVNAVNASMSKTRCGKAALRGTVRAPLPASLDAGGIRIDITGNTTSAHVTANRLAKTGFTGGRRMTLNAPPVEVRGWYVVELKAARQVAVLLATQEPDGTVTEKWMELWVTPPAAKPVPLDVARRWLLALAVHDAAALSRLTAGSFERVGFAPAKGERADTCVNKRVAKKPAAVGAVLDCALAEAPARYVGIYDEQEFAKIDPKRVPAELAAHATALAKLAKAGHALVQFSASGVTVAFAIKGGKVAAVFEHVGSN